jgi:Holliday junction resolvasome RuvABC DNA-binding subunit
MRQNNRHYQIFKNRLGKLPFTARKVIVESVKKNVKQFERYFDNLESGILKEENKKDEAWSKKLFLSLVDAGYDDRKAEKFVDFLVGGNYRKFLKNTNDPNFEKSYETNKPGKYVSDGKRRGEKGIFSRQGRPAPVGKLKSNKASSDPFGEYTEKNTDSSDDPIDSKTLKKMKLVKPEPKKDGLLKRGMKKVADMIAPNRKWRKQIEESMLKAIQQKDYKKLVVIKENMTKMIEKILLQETEKVNQSGKSVVKENFFSKKKPLNQEKPVEFNAEKAAKHFADFNYESGKYDKIELDKNNNNEFASVYLYFKDENNKQIMHKFVFKDGEYRNVTTSSPSKKFPVNML